ncbi:MAG: CapA family protein [Thiohalocapsa sp.]|uniref:CapA family protein n=1 Tax=Thiohalocapsa sp. TaxID=2497641 RepID=UPI0025DF4865|nr:CapA family protein [Thiohalocapsa sp.]MCG6942782.1 CapA family protein [Thiohalocapsa sp.]
MPQPNHQPLILCAFGDVMLHGRYQERADAGTADAVLAPLAALLADADLAVGNLETPLTRTDAARADKLCLRGDPVYAGCLARAGVSVLNLANNHCMDFGAEALAETRELLGAAGIACTGAGANLAEAMAPIVIERRGVRVGLLGACDPLTKPAPPATGTSAGIAPLDPDAVLAAVDRLRPRVDHVILMLHWGLEYSPLPTPEQVAFGDTACARGVSVILGHHSHCIQGVEQRGAAVVAYSLANLTDDGVDLKTPQRHYLAPLTDVDRESFLLRLALHKDHVELLDPVPLWLDDAGRPTRASGELAEKIRATLAGCTARLADTGDLEAYWADSVIERRVAGPLISWWRDGSLWDKIRRFRPGQLVSAWLLLSTYLKVRLSRSGERWLLYNERNDTRPMPTVREPRGDSGATGPSAN